MLLIQFFAAEPAARSGVAARPQAHLSRFLQVRPPRFHHAAWVLIKVDFQDVTPIAKRARYHGGLQTSQGLESKPGSMYVAIIIK